MLHRKFKWFDDDGPKRLADLHMLTFVSSWEPGLRSGSGQKFPTEDVRCTNFPFVVTNGDVLEHRIATIIHSVRDNAIPVVSEAVI